MFLSDNNNNNNINNNNSNKQESKLEKCESEQVLHKPLKHTSSLSLLPDGNTYNFQQQQQQQQNKEHNNINDKDLKILKPKLKLSKCNLDSSSLIVSTAFPPINSSRRNRSSLIEEKVPPIVYCIYILFV